MATAEEDIRSRTGLQVGVNGAFNATRTFRLLMDAAGSNPIDIIQRSTTTGGVSIGDAYPWVSVPLFLAAFSIQDMLTPRLYVVNAIYAPPIVLSGLTNTAWTMRTRAGLETEHRLYDLDGKGIGPAKYRVHNDGLTSVQSPYQVQSDDGTSTPLFLAERNDQVVNNDPIGAASSAKRRFLHGTDRYIPGGAIQFTKVIPRFDTSTVGFANANIGTVNSDTFYAFTSAQQTLVNLGPQGVFMLTGVSADPDQNIVFGDLTYPAYRVTLDIQYRRDGWNHVLQHTYKRDDGSEAPIEAVTGEGLVPVVETYRMYDELSFTGLLESM